MLNSPFKPRLSCADFTFPLLPHVASLNLIQLLNLEGVDIGLFSERSHLQPKDIWRHEARVGKELASRVADLGLQVSDVFIQPGAHLSERAANHPNCADRQEGIDIFLSALEFTAACGCRHLTGLPGMPFEGVSAEDSFKLAAEQSSWRATEAAKLGITYGVEAHIGSIAPTPEKALDLLHQSDGLSLTLDYGHFIYAGFSNEAIHPLLAHASHFHARGGARGQLQATMKENVIDFSHIGKALQERNYPGWICLEYVWIDWEGCNRADTVSETALLREHLREKRV